MSRLLVSVEPSNGAPVQTTRRRTRFLSDCEEQELIRRWKDLGDERALSKLIEAHMPIVAGLARKFARASLGRDDLMQEGAIGLLQAARHFDDTRGLRFGQYAKWWVRAAISMYVMRNASIVRPGTSAKHVHLFFKLAAMKSRGGFDWRLPDEEGQRLARETGTRLATVAALDARVNGVDVPLNAHIAPGSVGEVQDLLADSGPDPEMIVSAKQQDTMLSASLNSALQTLNDRERTVIRERYLRENRTKLETLARHFGVTKERIRQIEKGAVGRLARHVQNACTDQIGLDFLAQASHLGDSLGRLGQSL